MRWRADCDLGDDGLARSRRRRDDDRALGLERAQRRQLELVERKREELRHRLLRRSACVERGRELLDLLVAGDGRLLDAGGGREARCDGGARRTRRHRRTDASALQQRESEHRVSEHVTAPRETAV